MGGVKGAIFGVDPQEQERKRAFSDAYRTKRIQDYTTLSQEVQKVLTTGQVLDKTTGQMRPLTEAEKAQLTSVSQHVQNYIQKLYDPKIDPMSGMLNEDPIHKLTDKLRLTKAPKQPMAEGGKTPGQQIQDLNQMRSQFETQYGGGELTPEEQRKAAKVAAKIEPPAVAEKPKKGYKYDAAVDEVLDQDTGERYSRNQGNLPPAVADMFKGQESVAAKKAAAKQTGQTETVSESTSTTDLATGAIHTVRKTRKVPITSNTGKLASEVGPQTSRSAQPSGAKTAPVASGANAALKSITDAGVRKLVEDIGNYKMDISKITSMRGSQRQRIMALVAAAFPDFDMQKYPMRQQVLNSFTSGQDKRNILSLNTAIGHLQTLKEAADDLGNSSLPAMNSVRNRILQETGDPRIVAFDNAANAVESEMANVFKGTGATDQEIKAWRTNLNVNFSPEQFQASINTLIHLMGSRMEALNSVWQNAFGSNMNFPLLNSQSKQILSSISDGGVERQGGEGEAVEEYVRDPKTGKLVKKGS